MAAKRSSTGFNLGGVVLVVVVVVVFLVISPTRPPLCSASTAETAPEEPSASWTKWASDKFSEEVGLRQDNARAASAKMKEKAGDVAAQAKDGLSGAAEYALHMAGEVKERVADMAGTVVRNIMAEVGDDDEAAAETAYEGAKQRAAESLESAKDVASGYPRRSYEAAKEKSSQAAGEMEAKMQEIAEEL